MPQVILKEGNSSMMVGKMTSEGVEKLARDMGFDPEASAEVLVLMYLCECVNYGEISFEELKKYVSKIRCGDLKSF
jgi:hypothetical protein